MIGSVTAEAGEYTEVQGLKTFFIRKGHGPALVLLHGQGPGAASKVIWGANIDYFASHGFTVYAFDQVGFGRTDHVADVSMEPRVAHANAFVAAMDIERYSVWGESVGSYIAGRMAIENQRVERLVLQASGMLAPRPSNQGSQAGHSGLPSEISQFQPTADGVRHYLLDFLVKNRDVVSDELVAEMQAMSSGDNHDAFIRRQSAPPPKPIYDDLSKLTVPALVMWGKNDSVDVSRALLLLDYLPGAELHVFDRCGHWIQRDQADRANSLVRDFLLGGMKPMGDHGEGEHSGA